MLVKRGALVLAVDDPAQITVHIPTAKYLRYKNKNIIAVKHTLESAKILRNLGLDAPSPILYDGFVFGGRYSPMVHQTKTAEFLTLHNRAFVFNTMGCVDSETEYLSPTGWKRIADYDGGDVAQFNKDTKKVTFITPNAYIKRPCDTMIQFKTTRGVDQLLSPEHRVLYVGSTKKLAVKSAQEIMDADAKTSHGWSGKFITTFTPETPTSLALSDEEIRVMVAVIADGHFGRNTPHCVMRLKKERKVERIRKLLGDANIPYREVLDKSESGFGFHVFTFAAPRREKDFGAWWGCSLPQLHVIVNEVFNWDGCYRKDGASDFSSYVEVSADFIQYACAACGRTATLNVQYRADGGTEYVVHAQKDSAMPSLQGVTSEGKKIQNICYSASTDGYKYCFSVPDTFWVMRRNGRIAITGNTGKSAAALWSLDYLKQRGYIRKILIISPLSVMDVWMHEMFLTLPHRSSVQLVGKRERRVDILNSGSDICVINYDGVVSIQKEITVWKPDLVIVDEASAYCNPQTQRYKALKSILTASTRLWMLTGTPIPNAPTDAYGLIRLVAPSTVPPSFGLFRDTLMNRYGPYKWVPKPGALDRVYELMQPAIRFTKKDCFDLPPITYNFRQCSMSEKQLEVFKNVREEMKHTDIESGSEVKAVNAATKLIKLQQIMCGIVKDTDGNPIDLGPKSRLETVDELVSQSEAKVIIFVPFIYAMHLVQNHLNSKYETALVNGQVGKSKREEIFRTFQTTDKIKILIAHPKVAAHGLTLTAANTIIWYAPIFSIDQYIQANARIERTGQKLSMSIYNLYCHSVEYAIYNLLQARESLQAKVLELYEDALA